MDNTVLVSAVDGLNPRCIAAVRAFRTRHLGLESAAWLDPRHRPRLLSSSFTADTFKPHFMAADQAALNGRASSHLFSFGIGRGWPQAALHSRCPCIQNTTSRTRIRGLARPAPSSASLIIAIYRGHLQAALHGRGPCLRNVVSRIEICGLARPALCGRAAWPLTVPLTGSGRAERSHFVPFVWVSRIKIRVSPSSAVHARGRPASLHLFY
ncbi:hypothetical protein F2Q68_00008199 [Brassica cretica]|uniref:Uncharacterized protein n=1 Tax=Brassica cretica TaxID=69181 RepID=A0A8S9L076_BRACR|nr:hypothetical protein F2Q68_00008199 [Brassica cretica]